MVKYEEYLNDPDIINEPRPLREVHAIRLMLHEETKNMTPREYTRYVHDQAMNAIEKHGLKVIHQCS